MQVFVARVTDALTDDDLRKHFEQFGEASHSSFISYDVQKHFSPHFGHSNFQITDLYCPRPSRGFAFVQFVEARVAKSLLEKDHVIKGVSVHIGAAKPKGPTASRNDFGGSGGGRGMRGDGGGGGGGGSYYGDRDRGGNQGSWQRHPNDRQYDPFRDRWV